MNQPTPVVNVALPRLQDFAFNLEAVALQIAHHPGTNVVEKHFIILQVVLVRDQNYKRNQE
jgi:hypothetical protein